MCALALFKIHLSPEKQNNCWGKKKKKNQTASALSSLQTVILLRQLSWKKKGIYRLNVTPNRMVKFSLMIHTP